MLKAAALQRIDGLVHGFLERRESLGDVSGLGSVPASATSIVYMEQVHGARVACVDERASGVERGVDALVTASPGTALVVRTADCIPALFAAPDAAAVAAAHAGWRGLLAGVLAATVRQLVRTAKVAPADVLCALGPAIGGCCYEFPRPLLERFIESHGPRCMEAWRESGARGYLDIRTLARSELEAAGLAPNNISLVGGCTSCSPDSFHSYRRDGSRAGRQLSFILWRLRGP